MNDKRVDSHLYWIGPRESDIEAIKARFSGSITFFGNQGKEGYCGEGASRGNHTLSREQKVDHNNLDDQSLDRFVYETVRKIKETDPRAKFMMYNPNVLRPHSKNVPDRELTEE